MQKPVVDALEAAANVKAGMSDAQLMKKYGVSAEGLQSLFRKLVSSGILKPAEIEARLSAETVFIDLASAYKEQSADEFTIDPVSQNACLLAITTNLAVLDMAKVWAQEHGLQVVNCGDGALGAAISKMVRPTMILVELLVTTLTDIDSLRQACAGAPIILLCRPDERDLLDQCLDLGADSFVDLPLGKKAFVHALDRTLEYGKLIQSQQESENRADQYKAQRNSRAKVSDELSNLILDSLTTVSIIMSDAEQDVLYWNKGAESVFGYTAEEMLGEKLTRLYPPNSSTIGAVDQLYKTVKAKATPVSAKIKQITKDHRVLTIFSALSPVLAEDGAVEAVVTVGMDITHEIRKETEILQALRRKKKARSDQAS
jgi:two-component system, cell cycle sensor histidine kinase and response regulator CckA